MAEVIKADASAAGCWIDGHWGQYGTARLVELAEAHGYSDAEDIRVAHKHLASMGPSTSPDLTDSEYEYLMDGDDSVTAWLNDHVAPAGHSFGWYDGEYFLWSTETWEEE